jgi:hypothetical protein
MNMHARTKVAELGVGELEPKPPVKRHWLSGMFILFAGAVTVVWIGFLFWLAGYAFGTW